MARILRNFQHAWKKVSLKRLISNNCGVWSYMVEQNRESDEEHDEDCVEEGFQLNKGKNDRDGEAGRKL